MHVRLQTADHLPLLLHLCYDNPLVAASTIWLTSGANYQSCYNFLDTRSFTLTKLSRKYRKVYRPHTDLTTQSLSIFVVQ